MGDARVESRKGCYDGEIDKFVGEYEFPGVTVIQDSYRPDINSTEDYSMCNCCIRPLHAVRTR